MSEVFEGKEVFEEKIERLRAMGLLRESRDRGSPQGPGIVIDGRALVNFASNDYLGLAANEALILASQRASREFGAGAGAARLLAGGARLHGELEREAASFMGAPGALLFNSGYHANTGAIPALAARGDAIFSDELNHASIIDGCRLSRADTFIYRHADAAHARQLLEKSGDKNKRKLIITESVFSMDGDIAPLDALHGLAKDHGAILYVDEAHAVGVLGGGRGGLSHFGLSAETGTTGAAIIRMGTFSKAFGSYGAFVAAGTGTVDWLRNAARTFIFSTALPPGPVGAALAALRLVGSDEGPALIARLWENREMLFRGLKEAGFETGPTRTPIIPVFFDAVDEALHASADLYAAGLYAPAIRPPAVDRPRLRLQASAAHSPEDIEGLLDALRRIRKQ